MLSELEMKMMKRIVQLKWRDCESNPVIGIGPFPSSVVQCEEERLGIKLSVAEKLALEKEINSDGYY